MNDYFWAKQSLDEKPGISVYDHMVNVGCVARCIAEISPALLNRLHLSSSVVGALAALHDLGKISPGFQRKSEVWLKEKGLTKIAHNGCWDVVMESDHGKVSHSAIQTFLLEFGIDCKTAKFISAVLGAHHGRLNPPNDRGYLPKKLISDSDSCIDWNAERMKNARMIWDYFQGGSTFIAVSEESSSLWWLAGLASVADWIGSDERFFSSNRLTVQTNVSSIASDAINTIGFLPPSLKQGLSFNALFGFDPNAMQVHALAAITDPGVYVIEAPMGMGKTEAALSVAYQLMAAGKASGIYFALPTQTTSNRMHLRMNEFIKVIAPEVSGSNLIHGNSWLMQTETGIFPLATDKQETAANDARIGRDWFASAKRALIAPFGVGTVDQALLSVVAAKHFFVRRFGLAGKVVILDEIHSYDLYTGTLIDNLIKTLEGLGCTVIVLSATLTEKRRRQILSSERMSEDLKNPYPLISGRNEGRFIDPVAAAEPNPYNVKVEFISVEQASQEAIKMAGNGGAVLWVCNTIDVAQKQYDRLKNSSFPVGLLHSRFPFFQREKIESEWMGRLGKEGKTRRGSILVSTQIVEQSVDLDADLLITELAPTDMLLQRLGRLWRHKRDRPNGAYPCICIIKEDTDLPNFRIMSPREIKESLGAKAAIYDPFILLRSLEVWQEKTEIIIPVQIRALIEATYEDREDDPESWTSLFDEMFAKTISYRQKAMMSNNIWQVALDDEECVQTRLNELPTIALVFCRTLTDSEAVFMDYSRVHLGGDQYQLALAQAIHMNLVRIPRYLFDAVVSCSVFADYLYGAQVVGIVEEDGVVTSKGLKNGFRLVYTEKLGLVIEKTIS